MSVRAQVCIHITALVYVRKYATECASIHKRVCGGCVRMCISLHSHVSVRMREHVHMLSCVHALVCVCIRV